MAEGAPGPSNRDLATGKEANLVDSTAAYVLKITEWSKKRKDKEHGKDDLSADVFTDKVGNQWQLLYNINGNSSVKDDEYLSLFVAISGREELPFAWTKHVTFSFTLQHPDDPEDQQNKDGLNTKCKLCRKAAAAFKRQRDADQRAEDDVEAGLRQTRKLPDPRKPKPEDIAEHVKIHLPCHTWCKHCVRGRG